MAQIEIKSRFVEVTKNIALTKEGTKIEHLYLGSEPNLTS